MKTVRKIMYPELRVLRAGCLPSSFEVNEESDFHRIFTDEEILESVIAEKGKNCYNGKCIRLDDFNNGNCKLSVVNFFDFLTTNLTYLPANKNLRYKQKFMASAYDSIHGFISDEPSMEQRLKTTINRYGKLNSFDRVLGVRELANIVTVSILLEDSDGNYLIMKRGNKVVISSGNFAVSAAGSVDKNDLANADPFKNCAIREVKEELGLDIDLVCTGMVISKQKLQPAVLFKGMVNGRFNDLSSVMRNAPDFNNENTSMFAVPKRWLVKMVKSFQFTDVAAYQLFQEKRVSRLEWSGTIGKFKIEDFQI